MRLLAINHFLVVVSALFLVSCDDNSTKSEAHSPSLKKQTREIQPINSTGYGETKESAIHNALLQAKEQIYGVRITKKSFIQTAKLQLAISGHNNLNRATEINISEEQKENNIISSEADILSYEIVSERYDKTLGWVVKVCSKMYSPPKDMLADKISLVASPAQDIDQALSKFGFPQHITSTLSQDILENFSEAFGTSDEFVLLNRTDPIVEKEHIHTSIAKIEPSQSNSLKTADFILSIHPERGSFQITPQVYPTTNQTVYRGQWSVTFSIKMIDPSSGAILASVNTSISGKGNSFSEKKCIDSCTKDAREKIADKIRDAGGLLVFRLGYPQLQKPLLLTSQENTYVYQFIIKGPHLLSSNKSITLYSITSENKEEIISGIILSYSSNTRQLILKTDKKLPLLSEGSFLLAAPISQKINIPNVTSNEP